MVLKTVLLLNINSGQPRRNGDANRCRARLLGQVKLSKAKPSVCVQKERAVAQSTCALRTPEIT